MENQPIQFPVSQAENQKYDSIKELKDYNKEDLLRELAMPKQSFDVPDPSPLKTSNPGDGPQYNFEGANEPFDFAGQEQKRLAARANAKITAEMIDHGLGTVGQLIAKSEESKPYKADQGELSTLTEAWAGVVADYDFNIPPWVQLVILYPAIYGPKMIKANNDRRFNIMENEMRKMKEQISDLENKKDILEKTKEVA